MSKCLPFFEVLLVVLGAGRWALFGFEIRVVNPPNVELRFFSTSF